MCAGGRSGLSWWMDGSGCPSPCPCPRTVIGSCGTVTGTGESELRSASGSGRGRFGERRSLCNSVGVCVRARRADGGVLRGCCCCCDLRADGGDVDGGREPEARAGCGCGCGSDGLRAAGCMALIVQQARTGNAYVRGYICMYVCMYRASQRRRGGRRTGFLHSPHDLYKNTSEHIAVTV